MSTPQQVRADFEAAFPRWEGDKGMASAWVGWEACHRHLAAKAEESAKSAESVWLVREDDDDMWDFCFHEPKALIEDGWQAIRYQEVKP